MYTNTWVVDVVSAGRPLAGGDLCINNPIDVYVYEVNLYARQKVELS